MHVLFSGWAGVSAGANEFSQGGCRIAPRSGEKQRWRNESRSGLTYVR
jgi:hypothetical protein